jgi:hypothetical protein
LELPSNNIEQELTRATKIRTFLNEFTKIAEQIAKIIINERNVPNQDKTIKSSTVGGIAGYFCFSLFI